MPRPDLSRVVPFFHNYISQVPHDDILPALKDLGNEFVSLMKSIPASKYDYSYAPGKWTLKEMFQHIIDTERILGYRALCFARKETQSLPSFDEDSYAANSKASKRDWNEMIEEFETVRKTTVIMYKNFDEEQLEADGIANNRPLYVRGLGFIIPGHCQHHVNIIKERYLK